MPRGVSRLRRDSRPRPGAIPVECFAAPVRPVRGQPRRRAGLDFRALRKPTALPSQSIESCRTAVEGRRRRTSDTTEINARRVVKVKLTRPASDAPHRPTRQSAVDPPGKPIGVAVRPPREVAQTDDRPQAVVATLGDDQSAVVSGPTSQAGQDGPTGLRGRRLWRGALSARENCLFGTTFDVAGGHGSKLNSWSFRGRVARGLARHGR